jgi:hypothetical protein
MISMRKLFFVSIAIVLTAFALPASAQKTFIIAPPSSLPVGTQTIQVTFTNTGNSNFNSLELDATSSNLTFNPSPAPSLSSGFSGQVSILSPTQLQFVKLSPGVKKSITVSVSVTTTSTGSASCAPANATWSAQAWEGSPSNPSQTFALTPPSPYVTTVNPGCTMTFSTEPVGSALSDGLLGSATKPVTVQVSPASLFSNKSITLSFASGPAGGSLTSQNSNTPYGPVAINGGFASFPGLVLNGSAGTYTLGASTGVTGDPTATSTPIAITAGAGPLNCNDAFDSGGTPGTPGYVSGTRGVYNKDGVTGPNCVRVPYSLVPPSSTNNSNGFQWDTLSQPYATFAYTVNWFPLGIDSDGWTADQPLVAWESGLYGVTGPDYVPGLACLSPNLPAPYATLVADNVATITVDTTTGAIPLPAGSFPIVINTERMQATVASGTGNAVVLNVTRGQGGTIQAAHSSGALVMSTPLPIDPNAMITDTASPLNGKSNPYYLKQAHVCIAAHAWSSGAPDSMGNTIYYVTTVIDIGDSQVKLP